MESGSSPDELVPATGVHIWAFEWCTLDHSAV